MSILLTDVHSSPELEDAMKKGYTNGIDSSEILYADDTAIFSESEDALDTLLKAIESEGDLYGMKINNSKCDLIYFGHVPRNIASLGGTNLLCSIQRKNAWENKPTFV